MNGCQAFLPATELALSNYRRGQESARSKACFVRNSTSSLIPILQVFSAAAATLTDDRQVFFTSSERLAMFRMTESHGGTMSVWGDLTSFVIWSIICPKLKSSLTLTGAKKCTLQQLIAQCASLQKVSLSVERANMFICYKHSLSIVYLQWGLKPDTLYFMPLRRYFIPTT